jgi:hypothetical protein
MSDASPNANGLPIFYRSPRPVDRVRDGDRRVRRLGFNFSRKTNAVPLTIDEFPMAAAYYPIVFAAGPVPIPAAVVGLEKDSNLFVSEDGKWQLGAYLPAYVRRYPFIMMDDPNDKQMILCVDEDSGFLDDAEGERLFEHGEPSKFLKSALEFCAELRSLGDATDAFVKALHQYDLFEQADTSIRLGKGHTLQLDGLLTISPARFDALPEDVILHWRRNGWIGLIYAQLLSSHRWANLTQLLDEQGGWQGPTGSAPASAGPAVDPASNDEEMPRLRDAITTPAREVFRLAKRPGRGKDF